MGSLQRRYHASVVLLLLTHACRTRQLVHHIGTVWGVKKYKTGKRKSPHSSPPRLGYQENTTGDGTNSENSTTTQDMVDGHSDYSNNPQALGENHNIPQTPIMDTAGQTLHAQFAAAFDHQLYQLGTGAAEPAARRSHPSPGQNHGHSSQQTRLLADILFACGDSAAFWLYKSLLSQSNSQEERLHDLVACTRAAQTAQDAEEARDALQEHVDDILDGHDDISLMATLVDLQAARTYDWYNDKENAIGQIEQRILSITINAGDRPELKPDLGRRNHSLDIPLYDYFGYALKRWNDGSNGEQDSEPIDIDDFLRRFVVLQLGPNRLTCLSSCLRWCIDTLKKRPTIPMTLRNTSGDALAATYQIIGALWESLRSDESAPLIEEAARQELGISAAELLVTITCMIMTKVAAANPFPDDLILGALYGATALEDLDDDVLLHSFLQQVRRNNDRRIPGADHGPPSPIMLALRAFAFEAMRFSRRQDDDQNCPIIPVVLAQPSGNAHRMTRRSQYHGEPW